MQPSNKAIFEAVSLGASVSSTTISMDQFFGCGIQATWVGNMVGTLTVQISNDPGPSALGSTASGAITNWTDITDSVQSLAGIAGTFYWNLDDLMCQWVRLSYARTSGTGTINARIVCKGV